MNTIHDEVKIRELFNDDRSWSDNMRQYAEYIREKTIDECINNCYPGNINDSYLEDDEEEYFYHKGWNEALKTYRDNILSYKTITNFNNLRNNG